MNVLNFSRDSFYIQDRINHPDTIIIYQEYDEQIEEGYINCYNKLKQIDMQLYNLFLFGMLLSCLFCNIYRRPKKPQLIYVENEKENKQNKNKNIVPAEIIEQEYKV